MTTKTNTRQQSEQRIQKPGIRQNFGPLLLDVAVPVGAYYLLKDALGTSTFAALAWSSLVPAARTVWSVVKERKANAFAALILVVNVVSLALSFVSGDPRLMLAKDSGVSSTIGIGVLVSVVLGKPMMTAGLKPFILRGDKAREAAWERLAVGAAEGSAAFLRLERVFSVVWGVVLLAECVVRVVGAYTVPVDTMVWLGSVIMIAAMALGMVVGGSLAAEPIARLVGAEARRECECEQPAEPAAVPVLATA